jgi:hypothetical protein
MSPAPNYDSLALKKTPRTAGFFYACRFIGDRLTNVSINNLKTV